MKAAGTVTKKLAKWLADKGYAEDTADAQERAKEAVKDLPAAQDVLDLLDDFVDMNAPGATRTKSKITFGSRRSSRGNSGWNR